MRWETLTELRERRHELNEPKLVPNSYGEATWQRDDRGMTMEKARAAVAEVLKKTEAKGSAAAIKYSYELVEAAGGEGATFDNYLAVLRKRGESDD